MFKTRYRIVKRDKDYFQIEKKNPWSLKWVYVRSKLSLEEAEEDAKLLANPFIKYI